MAELGRLSENEAHAVDRAARRAGDRVRYRGGSGNAKNRDREGPTLMSLSISGVGTALPPFTITQEAMAAFSEPLCCEDANQAELSQLIYAHSGVRRRHSVLLEADCQAPPVPQTFYPTHDCGRGPTTGRRMQEYEASAPPLAIAASQKALAAADLAPGDITHVVSVSCTGFMAPGIDMALVAGLGLKPTVERTHLGFMGCHGAINGLKVARGCLGAEPDGRVLVCCVELCTLHFYMGWDPEKIVANALFADGAAAVVCKRGSHSGRDQETQSRADKLNVPEDWRLAAVGTVRIPDSETAMTWRIGDFGFEMGLSRRIPELIGMHLRGYVESWLDRLDFRLSDIRSWAIHPGGPKILDAVELALSLSPASLGPSRGVLAEHGNMSSPTLLFILDRLRRACAPRPCVALGFGPGMVVEAALFL
jgi:predicted naringenin-chalcone synthase